MLDAQLLNYAQQHSAAEPAYLQALERATHLHTTQPIMLSGFAQGRLLSLISKLMQPKCILEIGTFTGYSALCLAEGLATDGVLHTIDNNIELKDIIDEHINLSPYAQKINVHYGQALQVIPTLNIEPLLIFIDADKPNYIAYLDICLPLLAKGGVILADNVLFHGQVLEANAGKNAEAIKAFNNYASKHPDINVSILPIRDGISVITKK
jgi:caffeoyl-CoA O-methyltransferase